MIHWSASNDKLENWSPIGGWNSTFSESEKIECTNLFFFFKNKKGFKENTAEILAQMVIYKNKYIGLQYTLEQENILHEALQPIFSS
jgi:predicted adenine nucleotide alpha hydrolase (AANH) superfamily ATPase